MIKNNMFWFSLRKTVGKVSLILVTLTLTSHSDSDVKSLNVSLKETKPDVVNLNSNTATLERMKEKFYGFWQTVLTQFF